MTTSSAIRSLKSALTAALLLHLCACGTLLYPERRGQTSGRIDPGVAILDGVGLLFFIIPGLIAYAIDFSTGAIYVSGGKKRASAENYRVVLAKPEDLSPNRLERTLEKATGYSGLLHRSDVTAIPVNSVDQLSALFAQANAKLAQLPPTL